MLAQSYFTPRHSCFSAHLSHSLNSIQVRERLILGVCTGTKTINHGTPRLSIIQSIIEVNTMERKSKNYAPTIWTPKLIRTFKSPYNYEIYGNRLEELKEGVRSMLTHTLEKSHGKVIKLIDTIQQLGVAYHFENEMNEVLDSIYPNINTESDLSTLALEFRILRSSGFSVSSDVFNKFIDENGTFFNNLSEDIEGLINLYEASYLSMDGEHVLEEANNFTKKHLMLLMEKTEINTYVREQIRESLLVPLHWRMQKAETRHNIVAYERSSTMNKELLELAKLDFNLLQSVYLNELHDLATWWEELNFREKLPFARDRLIEVFFYVVGIVPDPQFSRCRINVAKLTTLATVLDDIYDTYGLFDELQQLTDAIDKWDTTAMEELPEYMRIWCSAMLDHVDETIQDGFNDLNIDVRPYIQAQWKTLTRVYQMEAKWVYEKEMPSFYEYVENGWVSIGVPMAMAYVYFGLFRDSKLPVDSTIMEYFELWYNSDLVRLPAVISRLLDDLLSSEGEMKIGEMANSIQCYMIEEGASEEEAVDHVWTTINSSWRKINTLVFQNMHSLPPRIANTAFDQTRCVSRLYKYVDLLGSQVTDNKNIATSTFFNPI